MITNAAAVPTTRAAANVKKEGTSMTPKNLEDVTHFTVSRAETYLHHAKVMVMKEFGPAAEHMHAEIAVSLAAAMMQHEGAQLIAGEAN